MEFGSIEEKRAEIASIDSEIAELISKRTEIAETIGSLKDRQKLPIRDPDTEEKVMRRYRELASSHGLPEDAMESVAKLLIAIAVDRQEKRKG